MWIRLWIYLQNWNSRSGHVAGLTTTYVNIRSVMAISRLDNGILHMEYHVSNSLLYNLAPLLISITPNRVKLVLSNLTKQAG